MVTIPTLSLSLLQLLFEIKGAKIKLILGGGFGIYLKVDYVRKNNLRTLFYEIPEARSTNDIDLYLRPELLIDSAKIKPLSDAISRLGYKPVPGAEKFQFIKTSTEGAQTGSVKLDILTGPQSCFKGMGIRTDARRVRPNPSVGMHAHPVDEAPTLEQGLLAVSVAGKLNSGLFWQDEVLLPSPYTYCMMKLFAFKDRLMDSNKEFGRYHAFDLFTILATTTESEWNTAIDLRNQNKDEPYVIEAGRIVAQYFSKAESLGIIRLRESRYFRPEYKIDELISALEELFPGKV